MDQREEFVRLALAAGANRSSLCRRFGISRSKGYKWLKRYAAEGRAGLSDRSRRPFRSPGRSADAVEAAVLHIRASSNDAWGGRKIAKAMARNGDPAVPAASTITEILRRHGKLERPEGEHPGPFQRFERAAPNELWQMDFKGHFPMSQGRCHPLTVLDDHSRYSVGLEACGNEQDATVRARLATLFRRYGLPFAMLMDNGSPWGDAGAQPFTLFTAWLIRLGIRVSHGRPYHPQTQGKDERFHRTLKAEVLDRNSFCDLAECQCAFDAWRQIYNHHRPHEALGLEPPGTRYRLSPRSFPEALRRSSTVPAMSSARSIATASSASKTIPGASARPSAGSPSRCARPATTASSASITAPSRSASSICEPGPPPVDLRTSPARCPQPHRRNNSNPLGRFERGGG